MGFGIWRLEKLHADAIGGREAEANRNAEHPKNFANSEIDWLKTDRNVYLVRSEIWAKSIEKTLQENAIKPPRKNAVVLLDSIITASPDDMKRMEETGEMMPFFRDALEWYGKHFGVVVNAVVHLDETTPHMHVQSVPVTADGRLCARDFCGGRAVMGRAQDAIENEVFARYGLDHRCVREPEQARKHMKLAAFKAKAEAEKLRKLREAVDELAGPAAESSTSLSGVENAIKTARPATAFGGLIKSETLVEIPKESLEKMQDAARTGAHAAMDFQDVRRENERLRKRNGELTRALASAQARADFASSRVDSLAAAAGKFLDAPEPVRDAANRFIDQRRREWRDDCVSVIRCMGTAVLRGAAPHDVAKRYAPATNALGIGNGAALPRDAARVMRKQMSGKASPHAGGGGWTPSVREIDFRQPIDRQAVAAAFGGAIPAAVQLDAEVYDAMLADWDLLDELTKDAVKNKRDLRDL